MAKCEGLPASMRGAAILRHSGPWKPAFEEMLDGWRAEKGRVDSPRDPRAYRASNIE